VHIQQDNVFVQLNDLTMSTKSKSKQCIESSKSPSNNKALYGVVAQVATCEWN
jgi:hypothetical protein